MARETKTRYEGVWVRHRKGCPAHDGRRCACRPSYLARVYDRRTGRKVASPSFPTIDAARSWRTDKLAAIDAGRSVTPATRRVRDVVEEFEQAARDGRALTKKRTRYRPAAISDLESAFRVWVVPEFGTDRMDQVRRGDVQRLVDAMVAEGLSGSRIRTVVNAMRSLYTYAVRRDICHASPITADISLPPMDETPRDRTMTAAEATTLLGALTLKDRAPYALAVYATGRRNEIRHLAWPDIDFEQRLIKWAVDERARKSRAALRDAPIVTPLWTILRELWMEQGQPTEGLVCPGWKAGGRNSGFLSFEALQARADEAWHPTDRDGRPILAKKVGDRFTAHEGRHVCSTWMDQAGVRPVVKAAIMGHSPEGGITQTRYTHVPIEDVHEAGRLLGRFLAARRRLKAV